MTIRVNMLGAMVLMLLCSCGYVTRGPAPLPIDGHMIYAEIMPDSAFLSCQDVLTLDLGRGDAGRFFFFLNEAFEVDRIEDGGGSLSFTASKAPRLEDYINDLDEETRDFYSNASVVVLEIPSGGEDVPEDGPRSLVVTYSGAVYDSLGVPGYSRGAEAEETRGLIDPQGTFLSPATHWYPCAGERMAVFNITGVTPEGYEVVTQGRLAEHKVDGGAAKSVWKGTHPSEAAYLVAGPYEINTIEQAGIELSTYFYNTEADLSEQYLGACARYFDMYNELLGPYPYAKFAVVENFFPTGYGMPSYTLLGRRVLRLPFIVHTSLGHEIAHNWWGNGVFVDPDGGNWCEGLTVYCADYRYKCLRDEAEAREYRRDINRDYTVYVTPENDFPLTEFAGRTTRATRAIGYGKCAMIFQMLEQMLGEEMMFETLRGIFAKYSFKQIGWNEIESEFSKAAGSDLDWFFSQWVHGTGAPLISITEAVARDAWPRYTLSLRLEQEGGPFRLSLPVMVRTETTVQWRTIEMEGPVAELELEFRSVPVAVSVDPEHVVMRRMAQRDIAPTLSVVLGDEGTVIVKPSGATGEAAAAYEDLAAQLGRPGGIKVITDTELTEAEARSQSLFILGGPGENAAFGNFEGEWPTTVFLDTGAFTIGEKTYESSDECALYVGRNPFIGGKAVAVVAGLSGHAVQACAGKLIHYGKYSHVVFNNGTAVDKGIWEVRDYPFKKVKFRALG